jgi:hypothetical protein
MARGNVGSTEVDGKVTRHVIPQTGDGQTTSERTRRREPAGPPSQDRHGWRADSRLASGLTDAARGYMAITTAPTGPPTSREHPMIVLGVILLLIGYFTGISILYTIGGILVVIGIVLWVLGAVGRPVGGRKVWF